MNELYNPGRVPVPPRKPDPDEIGLPLVAPWTMQMIKEHEGTADHLYKDTADKITIGTGFNVHGKPEEAHRMGLYWGDGRGGLTPRRAGMKDVHEAFRKIEDLPAGQPLGFYDPSSNKDLSDIRLGPQASDEILRRKLLQSENELKTKFRNFNKIPYPGRMALLDMQYNMGDSGFRRIYIDPRTGKDKGWPELYKAIESKDWKKAAKESHRFDVQEQRNMTIESMFLEAEQRKNAD